MAILGKLKELLGIGGASDAERGDTEVTVERETGSGVHTDESGSAVDDEERAGSDSDEENAAADVDEGSAGTDVDEGSAAADVDEEGTEVDVGETTTEDSPVAEATDAAASTGSLVDEEAADDPDHAAEPAEAAGPGSDETEVPDQGEQSVEQIKGIGPAYAERLADTGVVTVADLAAADSETIAAEANVGEKRARTWIDRAKDF